MNKADFDAFVKRQQADEEKKTGFDPKQQLREWLDYLNALYEQIADHMQRYLENGAAKITRRGLPRIYRRGVLILLCQPQTARR